MSYHVAGINVSFFAQSFAVSVDRDSCRVFATICRRVERGHAYCMLLKHSTSHPAGYTDARPLQISGDSTACMDVMAKDLAPEALLLPALGNTFGVPSV